jgi:hypothetical protein
MRTSRSALDRQAVGGQRTAPSQLPSRRNALKTAAGLAAAGAVGGSALASAATTPASAASRSTALDELTSIEQGAVAPAVVLLTDASTIAVDASLGNDFRVTLGGNRSMGDPANPADGQQIIFQVTQGAAAPCALTWSDDYEFAASLPQPTLSSAAGQTDLLGFVYNVAKGKWLLAAFVNGFG